eukprot:1184700-Prorocentrum_minimum.AAC.1
MYVPSRDWLRHPVYALSSRAIGLALPGAAPPAPPSPRTPRWACPGGQSRSPCPPCRKPPARTNGVRGEGIYRVPEPVAQGEGA